MEKLLECIERCRQQAQKNGAPQEITYKCNKCKDTEWILVKNADGYEVARHCECYEKNEAIRRMARSGISAEDMQKGFADFNTFGEGGLVTAKETAIGYYKAFDTVENSRANSLLLCGASGRGKTTLGMAVANNLIRNKGVNVRYMPYREEVTRLKQEIMQGEGAQYQDHMERLKRARVLFIDDLLKGKVTESDINIMYEIINYRYLERLPMIISTELTIPALVQFDEAIAGRLVEMSKGYTVVFDSSIPNYRMR